MWFNRGDMDDSSQLARVKRLENYHSHSHGAMFGLLALAFGGFIIWGMNFKIDEVTRTSGEVIASKRVQVIQAVDGGVLSKIMVKEGDHVRVGQELARLEQTRVGAVVAEAEARLFALQVKAIRLRAEVTGAPALVFSGAIPASHKELVDLERALFVQRRIGLAEEIRTLKVAVDLARKEQDLVQQLLKSGDVSGSEVLRAQRSVNESEARLANRKNKFLEDARIDLSKAEDEIAQNSQILTRRKQEQEDSVFDAKVAGIVKNIRVTTVGGVLRAGEEIMQIVPVDDQLIIETKIRPADIAHIRPGLAANIRFDPFDYTIFGSVPAKVTYVSADTLKEEKSRGEDIYYRVHLASESYPVMTSTGKRLEILPGMTAQVDIRTGERSLMDYLLKPIRKTLTESFGER